ncbi:hypothetical protein [Kitasatospora sp. NPDC056184]|uniref:hypothetical protein n=1 Tax=Kitasatospora sp. NPDC056184 TaxID=3345738 RepID=UPI0035E05F5E
MQGSEITAEQWEGLQGKVRRASVTVARSWGTALDAGDIEQEVLLKMVESPGFVRKSLDYGEASTGRLVRMMADQCASQLMNEYRRFTFQHYYSTWDVRRLLERGLLEGPEAASLMDAQVEVLVTGRKSKKDLAERVTHDDKIDLEYGMGRLKEAYRQVIIDRYVLGVEIPSRGTLSRAIEALAKHMNTSRARAEIDYEGVGSRACLGGTSARRATDTNY